MRIHERTLKVQKAGFDLGEAVINVIRDHGLTATEAVRLLLGEAQRWTNEALRVERHPDDPERKADEA